MESSGFFPDPGVQPVSDANAYESSALDDPLTSPNWTPSEVPGFAPPMALQEPEVAPPVALFAPAAPIPTAAPAATLIERSSPDVIHARPVHESTTTIAGLDLTALLASVVSMGASDLHLTAGARPMIRLNGSLQPLEETPELSPPVIQTMLYAILTQRQREKFEAELELDFAYAVPGQARFRVNLYRQRDAVGAAFRLIPFDIKPLEALGIPPSVSNFAMLPRGFVLVTGPTGSGKSTTLAGIVDL
ncbi:MAG TPA: ATPase, T2SS/T4P/T4SS family, partial [Acidothermaceae bacterium]|nr:ATPase, T2SS/T4P/T4SS family [Acidothermaceae bacterium]